VLYKSAAPPDGSEVTAMRNMSVPDNPSAPPGEIVKTATITDRYLPGTRLRLRLTRETASDTTRTLYLNEAEFEHLRAGDWR
jgi:hypothetical protein